ncbi:Na(+)/H(+) exchanger beta-like [Bacillus rossius redtenbacheri]|uniref:Na(+)/H(+) exchanger beta-like n=1 Tax=Bacillus rossius redtenbacheri TaxID=93214 RepID=UPI002FDDA038
MITTGQLQQEQVILESAYSLYDRAFAFNFHTILLYAVIGTLINTFLIGPALFGLSEAGMIGPMARTEDGVLYHVSLIDCLVFSALISAVDPVAVLAIFQEVGVNKDLYYLVFGESLLNDAVTVVLYTTMEAFSKMAEVPAEQYGLATLAFFTVSLGGCAVGVLLGLLSALITRATGDVRVVEPLAVLGLAYISYLTAELFHFSGIISIIFCGIVQAHYALKNISQKSYVTVKYFTRMVSSTCDAIIFLFLGMVLVNDRHVWHTGFVIWTLILCFVCRFIGVFSLTALANLYRVMPISGKEQFIMAYGGLRGAVAFSLAEMLSEDTVRPRSIFVTTTLVVILFTVFLQGSTIKFLVNLLHISKSKSGQKSLNEELGDHVLSLVMSGIEEIVGIRSDFYIRRKFEQLDDSCLKRIFLKPGKQSDLTIIFEKLAMTEHFTHLYGPLAVAEQSSRAKHAPVDTKPGSSSVYRTHSCRTTARFSLLYPGSFLQPRYQEMLEDPDTAGTLRKVLQSGPYHQIQGHLNTDAMVSEGLSVQEQLEARHLKTMQMAELAAQARDLDDVFYPPGSVSELAPTRRLVGSELSEEEGVPRGLLHGVQVILDRTERRLSQRLSTASSDPSTAWCPRQESAAAAESCV